jgi:TonB-linked SusC/RagA family outer membrane protein
MRNPKLCFAVLLGLAFAPGLLHAQATGSVRGAVTELGTERPLTGVQVFVPGTSVGTLTDQNGRFLLVNVPAGSQTVRATLIGYAEADRTVEVVAGQTAAVNIRLESSAIALQEIIVTGVSGATIQAKVPFDVARIDDSDIQVAPTTAAGAIQGKVAGATVVQGSGRPGTAPSILLRGAKSIDASGRSQEPLYIVDGVILGEEMVDISSLDIESIEVIKGAAASSLYGSRAANGVVQIQTKRGAGVGDDAVRYTIRSEMGTSQLPGEFWLTKSHQYLVEDGMFVQANTARTRCNYIECQGSIRLAGQAAGSATPDLWNTYQNVAWPGTTYDQVDRFFTGGDFLQNYVSASGRSGATNYHVSYNNLDDPGVMMGHGGLNRHNFRVNLDQAVRENISVSASAFYSLANLDPREGELFDLTRMKAGIDLTACEGDPTTSCLNDPENLMLLADPQNSESPNPLYSMLIPDYDRNRDRFLGSVDLRWTPIDFLDLDSNVSYDRLNQDQDNFFPKGYRTVTPSAGVNEGALTRDARETEAFNASVTGTMRFNLGQNVSNRTQLRYLFEEQNFTRTQTAGNTFTVDDIREFPNLDPEKITAYSYDQNVLSDGYYAITNFDIMDRYIIDALVRNDGSSLFGPDERRQWYYRLAGAWRMSQESWFNFPALDELKLRYAYGTAGNRPRFEAQYETFSVSGGRISPITLGNTALKPEFSIEQEAGVDAAFMGGRAVVGLTYANTVTEDQILRVPLPAYSGFSTQWRNAGTLESNTIEASLDARLMQTDNFLWSARVLFDRTRSEITELNTRPFTYGVGGQGLGDVYYAREGEELGTFYGVPFAQSCEDLPVDMSCDGFTVNDEGYLVWVGAGGLDANAWGSMSDVLVRGAAVRWGTPFRGECTDRVTEERSFSFCPLGRSVPDYKVSFSSSASYGGLSLYGLIDSEQGFDVYNQPLQWATFRHTSGQCDQGGVPIADAKPLGYCDALYQTSGLIPSTEYVEDGSYVKLRELALRYTVGAGQLGRLPAINQLSGLTFSLTGRNLYTWTDYRGYDPEVGETGGDTGSAALARVDGYNYPNFRTWILGVELNF